MAYREVRYRSRGSGSFGSNWLWDPEFKALGPNPLLNGATIVIRERRATV
jgi:hypothetical protein